MNLQNDLLEQTETAIEAKLNPQTRQEYNRIVLAGMKLAIEGGANGIMAKLKDQKDPVWACATGAVNVVFMMAKSGQNVPEKAMVPACYTLMLKALDIAARMGLVEITNEVIAKGAKIATDRIFAAARISEAKFNAIAGKVHGVMKDPRAMADIELKIGSTRDPRAPTPTLTDVEEVPNGAA